jgi:hypothetical protein
VRRPAGAIRTRPRFALRRLRGPGVGPGVGKSQRIHFDSPDDLIGHTLNERYKILEQLGSGGMGTVYLAEHVLINKRVAIKVLSPAHARKPNEVERFLREARAASRIRQPNVVDITDFGYTGGGLAFLVMEHLEGEDLATTSGSRGGAAVAPGGAHHAADLRGPRGCARAGGDPPRHEAGERVPRASWRRPGLH